jgi:hypothetical protein
MLSLVIEDIVLSIGDFGILFLGCLGRPTVLSIIFPEGHVPTVMLKGLSIFVFLANIQNTGSIKAF